MKLAYLNQASSPRLTDTERVSHNPFLAFKPIHQAAHRIVEQRGPRQKQDKIRCPEKIEQVGKDQQDKVAQAVVQQQILAVVAQDDQGQEGEKKKNARKDHAMILTLRTTD
jgi:hypothetical protein